MEAFEYRKLGSIVETLTAAATGQSRFVAGGTTLIDLMKLNVEKPQLVLDINDLPLNKVERMSDGGLRIGAMVRNSDLAHDKIVQQEFPVLSQALLSGASGQLRNMATTGGNLLQRTRCYYFRDPGYPCNKREPGTGCSALDGYNRIHAILGGSEHCIATHASDMAVAMMALEAVVHISGSQGEREVPLNDFYVVPGNTPGIETALHAGELITYVTIPKLPAGTKSFYLKRRDRASYEFALASAAVVAHLVDGRFRHIRIALGGIATKPWRSHEAEHALQGKTGSEADFRAAAEAALRGARPMHDNAFKVELAKRTLVRALKTVTQAE